MQMGRSSMDMVQKWRGSEIGSEDTEKDLEKKTSYGPEHTYLVFCLGVIFGLWGCGLAFGFRCQGCFRVQVIGYGEAGSFC